MHAAPLPRRAEHAPDGGLEALVGIRDDELHAREPALDQIAQEVGPEDLRLRRADVQADDLAPALGGDGHGDYRGDRDDAAALAHLEVGGIEPEIRPLARKRALQERVHPLIDVLAQLGHRGLRDAAQAHRLDEIVDAPGRDAGDPRLLDHRDERLLDRPPRLQEAGEVAAGPQLRDLEVERAQPRVEAALAVAVAVGGALAAALVAPAPISPSTSASIRICSTLSATVRRKSPSSAFASSSASGSLSSVIGGPWARVKSSNSTVAGPPDDHPTATPDASAKLHHDHGRYPWSRRCPLPEVS